MGAQVRGGVHLRSVFPEGGDALLQLLLPPCALGTLRRTPCRRLLRRCRLRLLSELCLHLARVRFRVRARVGLGLG